jgi:ubiquinone/menaquinone biosynthesis C-methylase UbiE
MSDIEKVKDYFIRSAVTFDSLYSEDKLSPLMSFINRRFRRDIYDRFVLAMDHVRQYKLQTALDVGCGSGRYALALSQAGMKRVVGADVSPKMIELAREMTSRAERADEIFSFVCGDFMELSTEEKFDIVLAMGFFDYIKDPVPVLKKMKTLANHSVIATFPSISIYRTPLRKIRYHFKRCPVYFYTSDDIRSLATEAGFRKHEIIKIPGSGMDYFTKFFV